MGKDKTVNKRTIKRLKIDEIIEPESAFSIGRTNTPKTGGEATLIARKAKSVAKPAPSKKTEVAKPSTYDMWAKDDDASVAVSKPQFERLRSVLSEMPAVPVPTGAFSYNPVPAEHFAMLQQLESQELERLADIEAIKQQIAIPEGDGKDMMIEANRKLILGQAYDESDNEEGEAKQVEGDSRSVLPTPRMTRADRRRQERRRVHEASVAFHRSRKLLFASIEKVPEYLQELQAFVEAERALEPLLPGLKKEAQVELFQSRIKKRLALEPLAVKLPEELPSCMRRLAAEGNLVSDRFRSFIERAVIDVNGKIASAPAIKRKDTKPRFRKVERFSYKHFK